MIKFFIIYDTGIDREETVKFGIKVMGRSGILIVHLFAPVHAYYQLINKPVWIWSCIVSIYDM